MLNESILDRGMITRPAKIPENDMVRRFLETVGAQARIAKTKKESLLIIICGHGTPADKHGVWLGDPSLLNPETRIMKMKDFESVLPKDLDVTVLSNACYSGGWAVNLNVTAFTAAGPVIKSEPWTRSDTLKG